MQTQHRFQKEVTITKEVGLSYLLSLPPNYEETEEKFPLVLFLHGMGERGNDLELIKKHGPPKLADEKEFPFILVSPQCPIEPRLANWLVYIDDLMVLVDDIIEKYRVDTKRVYVTGLSMGGYGTWALAKRYPDRFAAIAPICGGGSVEGIEKLKDLPIWVFHGAKDEVVPLSESEVLVEALRKVGGNVKFTIYPDADHDSWTETYENPEFYEWLLSQRKN